MSVAVGRNDFEHTVVNGQKRHVEGSASEIEDQDVLLTLFMEKSEKKTQNI